MSFPRYQHYKDSGVEWLGQVPEHWEIMQLKRVADPARAITYGIVQAGPHVPDGVPYIRPADMTDESGVASMDGILRTSIDIASAYSRSTIRSGDLVCSIGPSFGKVMVTPPELDGANLTQGTARIAVDQRFDPRYVFWALRSDNCNAQWESSVGGATFRALNLGPLAETVIPAPSKIEQSQIAGFLDRETAKIDGLARDQQRLIELLKEKRQAAISRAVTKGLNPDAPMKSSGDEWLSDVPAHWEVLPFKRRVSVAEGQVDPEAPQYSFMALIAPNHIESGTGRLLALESAAEQGAESGKYLCRAGDVVYSKIRPALRKVAIAPQDCLCSADMYPLRAHSGLTNTFLYWFILSEPFSAFAVLESARVAMPKINREALNALMIAVPPRGEQDAISGALSAETTKLDALVREAEHAIALLQERRATVISAAVTGKIDVCQLLEASAA